MKNYITLFFCLVAIRALGQVPIEVNLEDRPSSAGVQPAFEVMVPQATTADAIALWEKKIIDKKLFRKTQKIKKVNDEWQVHNVVISEITHLPLTVITQVSSFPGNIYVRSFFQTEGGFLGSPGSSEKTIEAAKKYIQQYAVDLYRLAVEKELKNETNILSSLEKELDKLISKNEKYNSRISEAQELQIDENQNDTEIINIGSGDSESDLKAAQKELNKAKRAESKFNKKARKNLKSQRDKTREIEKQNEKLEAIKTKLENIK